MDRFNVDDFIRASKVWVDSRVALADENRRNGTPDPLNICVDGILEDYKKGRYKKQGKKKKGEIKCLMNYKNKSEWP